MSGARVKDNIQSHRYFTTKTKHGNKHTDNEFSCVNCVCIRPLPLYICQLFMGFPVVSLRNVYIFGEIISSICSSSNQHNE